MNEIIWVTTITCFIGLILSALVTTSALKNIGNFGIDFQDNGSLP